MYGGTWRYIGVSTMSQQSDLPWNRWLTSAKTPLTTEAARTGSVGL